jgi:predicted DNA-binding transcriptional regulator AlpA
METALAEAPVLVPVTGGRGSADNGSDDEFEGRWLLRVGEAATRMAMSQSQLYSLIKQGLFPAVSISPSEKGGVRVRPGDVRDWIERGGVARTRERDPFAHAARSRRERVTERPSWLGGASRPARPNPIPSA